MGQGMVRVARSDGRLFQFQPKDVEAFITANPGAKKVATPPVSTAPSEAEVAATNAQQNVDNMTVAQLKSYAESNGIDLGENTVKADIIVAIKNAEAARND